MYINYYINGTTQEPLTSIGVLSADNEVNPTMSEK